MFERDQRDFKSKLVSIDVFDPFRKKWSEEYIRLSNRFNTGGLIATHPFTDLHVHVRLNGGEDYDSLEMAAKVGGFSTLLIQPNVNPPLASHEVVNQHISLIKDRDVKFLLTISPFGVLEPFNEEIIKAYSTDGTSYDYPKLVEAMRSKKKKILWIDHSQMYEIGGIFYEGTDIDVPKRPLSNEPIAIVRTVLTGLEYGFKRFHIQHVSNPFSVAAISWLRDHADVSCEVTPHHLLLSSEEIRNSNFKINPPLVSEKKRKELVEMVKKGLIDVLSSDHAPHSLKPNDYLTAPFGTSNLEVAFSAYFTAIGELELVIEKMTSKPMKLINVRSNLSENNLVFLDPNSTFEVDTKKFVSKGKNCVFDGMRLNAKVVGLKINGKMVMWDGEIIS